MARKVGGDAALGAAFAEPLGRVRRLLDQRRGNRGKLYALHAPEVECIGKGKARTRFEFGVKVSVAVTNAIAPGGQFVVGMRALPGRAPCRAVPTTGGRSRPRSSRRSG